MIKDTTMYKGVRFVPGTKAGDIQRYLLDHPHASRVEVLEELGLEDSDTNRATVSSCKSRIKAAKKRNVSYEDKAQNLPFNDAPGEEFQVKMKLPEAGIQLKLENGAGMLCTITLTNEGLTVRKANSKMKDPRLLSWDILEKLSAVGLF